ncbi:MAG TPA: tetratricopeptide repeat protein [Prolixibacteraceae bacterium]|nr:tetratricopeptide repeat protein [Prolixibacteraceae bacterium]
MKKILLLIVAISAFSAVFAQDLSEGLKAKNDGNDAFRNKDYVEAIKQWGIYLKSDEEGVADDVNTQTLYNNSHRFAASNFLQKKNFQSAYDYYVKYFELVPEDKSTNGKVIYEMAYCANQIEKNDEALSLYQTAIDLDYRADASMLRVADIYRKAGDDAKMTSILKDALSKYPQSRDRSKMITMLTIPMLKEASLPFNEANELAKAASGGDPAEYLANMSKAVQKFEEALPLFEDILKYDPNNEQARTYINACNDNIKSFNDYKATLKN